MKAKSLKVFPFILLLLIGCQDTSQRKENQIVVFNLSVLPKTSSVKLSDLGSVEITYIPMETNDSSVFACTGNIMTGGKPRVGNRFFVFKCTNDLYIFKDNGSFETKISHVGRGPNEYTVAHDVQIDERNNEIYLLAGWEKKFFVYSTKGELLRTFQIPFFCDQFIIVENGILCYSMNLMGNVDESYNLIDTNGGILKSYPNKYPFQNKTGYGILGENLFYHFNKRVFKKEVYSDTVYAFINDEFKPHLIINVGDKLISPNARSNFDGRYLTENFISPLNLFEFGNYVYYDFMIRFTYFSYIGSTTNDFQAIFDKGQGIINDVDGGPNILPKTIKDDYTILAWVDALQLKKHIASAEFKNIVPKFPERKKELEKLANGLKETDNPVLVMVTLKK